MRPPSPDIEIEELTIRAADEAATTYSITDKAVLEALKKDLRFPTLKKFISGGRRVRATCEIKLHGEKLRSYEAEIDFFNDKINLSIDYDDTGFMGSSSSIQMDDSVTPKMLQELRSAFKIDGAGLPSWEETRKLIK